MNIKNLDNGFLIDDVFAYNCDTDFKDYINLKSKIGESMKYDKSENIVVDFPGEYDIRGFGIEVIEVANLLHFIITSENDRFAILSHKKALQDENMNETVQTRVLSEESLREHLEKNELEGEVIILE